MNNPINHKPCLRPRCTNSAMTRGLCSPCYNIALKLVNENHITWEELEKAGKALPRMPIKRSSHAIDAENWLLVGAKKKPKPATEPTAKPTANNPAKHKFENTPARAFYGTFVSAHRIKRVTYPPTHALTCCLAMIFGLPVHEIPDFVASDSWRWRDGLREWLRNQNIATIWFDSPPELASKCIPFLGVGESTRNQGTHCVVMVGDKIFDPHPSNAGLTKLNEVVAFIPHAHNPMPIYLYPLSPNPNPGVNA